MQASGLKPQRDASRGVHLQVRGLQKVFLHGGRELPVLRGVDLELRPGELVAVVGASGAGKSTLLHLIGTLDRPSQGGVLFDGQDVMKLPSEKLADFRNRRIGFVFQFHHLLPEFSALENVMLPALIARMSTREATRLAEAMLVRMGLRERLTHRPGELSGGEQQRVALARALVLSPGLLLADEPTGNLDTTTGRQMHQLFFEISRAQGTTILLVTHNEELAAQAPRRVRMVDGRLEEDVRQPARPADPPAPGSTPGSEAPSS